MVLAAGGTAGHVYPALAVAEALRSRGVHDVRFVGTRHGLEGRLLAAHGLSLELVPGKPWQRRGAVGKGSALAAALAGFVVARRLLRRSRAEAVVGFGGYASVGTLLAARSLGIWTAIVEGNVGLGLANRLLAPRVDRLYTAAATRLPSALEGRACRCGLPLRRAVLAAAEAREERRGTRPRVLVLADPAHSAFLDRNAPELLAAVAALGAPISVHHQTAAEGVAEVQRRYTGMDARVSGYLDDIGPAYAAADLVVCRAGAGSVAELAACGLPALLVPLRDAAERHQERNAAAYATAGAALVSSEGDWDPAGLAPRVAALLGDAGAWSAMAARARAEALPGAADALLADAALAFARRKTAQR